jgi:polyhydroxybutyrate depolymerase
MTKIYSLAGSFLLSALLTVSYSQLTNKTMTVGSVSRSYKQYLPSGLDPQNEQVSLLVILHGLGGTNSDMVSAGFNTMIADTARVIAIYPQGLLNGWGQSSWNNGTLLSSTANDIGFMNQIIDSMILNYNVDPARVYFTGFSMGSIMSYHIACALNSRVAAIGCMAGTMATSDIQNCVPAYATPVIHLHGTADGTVPYNSGALPSLSLVPQTVAFWQNVHGCDATADSTRIDDLAADNITIDRFRYDNCNPTASLELWRLNGADHVYLYRPANDINEMLEVWLFLRRWTHSAPAAAGLNDEVITTIRIAPNPSDGIYTVSIEQTMPYAIRSLNGQTISSGMLKSGENTIVIADQPAGVYFLEVGNGVKKLVKL